MGIFRLLRSAPALFAVGMHATPLYSAEPVPSAVSVPSASPVETLEARAAAAEAGSEEQRMALLVLASRMLGVENRDRLLEITDELYANFPDNDEVCQTCGLYWIQAAEWKRLAPLLVARKMHSDEPIETLRAGIKAAREQHLLDSLLLLEAAYRAAPKEPKILLNLGSFYCRFGRGEEGLGLLEKVTELVPEDPFGYLAVAKGAKSLHKVETGIAAINAAQSIIRNNPVYQERLTQELDQLLEHFIKIDVGTVGAASEEAE